MQRLGNNLWQREIRLAPFPPLLEFYKQREDSANNYTPTVLSKLLIRGLNKLVDDGYSPHRQGKQCRAGTKKRASKSSHLVVRVSDVNTSPGSSGNK